jgi:spore photoproduct lyase
MNFKLEALFVEEAARSSELARRILARIDRSLPVSYIADGRQAIRPTPGLDPFACGKRRLVIMNRRSRFLGACPAGSAQFACCGYLVLVLASNCPMDCSYCFLQEYLADNPGFQIYANYTRAFEELERLSRSNPTRHFRVGTGELADSLAFDRLTGMSVDMVEFFARHERLTLEFKTKTDEIDNLLRLDPKGRVLVSWTLSTKRVYESSEHGAAAPEARINAARRLREAGYRVAFHLDPIIAYPQAAAEYGELLGALFEVLDPTEISFVSLGGLRMTPGLRAIARRRFPDDSMLAGEEVLSDDGRYRAFHPLRVKLYRGLSARIKAAAPNLMHYLCMETAAVAARALGAPPSSPAALSEWLATK